MSWVWQELFEFSWGGFEVGKTPECPHTMMEVVEEIWLRAKFEVETNGKTGVIIERGNVGRVMVARIGNVFAGFVRQTAVGRSDKIRCWGLENDEEEILCAIYHMVALCEPRNERIAEREIKKAEAMWKSKMLEAPARVVSAARVLWMRGVTVWETAERMWVRVGEELAEIDVSGSSAVSAWAVRETFEKRLGIRVKSGDDILSAAVLAILGRRERR